MCGHAPALRLQEAFLLFDLSGIRVGSLSTATLSLEVWGGQKGIEGLRAGHMEDLPLKVGVVDTGAAPWTELGLRWGNRPQAQPVVKPHIQPRLQVSSHGHSLMLDIDVTREVAALLMMNEASAPRRLGLKLWLDIPHGSSLTVASFYSREDGIGQAPSLTLRDKICTGDVQVARHGGEEFHRIAASGDATVRGGPWGSHNFGRERILSLHAGGGKDEFESFIQFDLPATFFDPHAPPRQLGRAEIKLHKWRMTPEHEVDDIKVHMVKEAWREDDITSTRTPQVGFNVLYCNKGAKLMPQDMYLNLDVTDEVQEALQEGRRSFSIRLSRQEGKHALQGTAPISFYSRENRDKAPTLNLQVLIAPDATATGGQKLPGEGGGQAAGAPEHHDLW